MDHNEFAGPTKGHIAAEKAGVIKPGSLVVVGETDPELLHYFTEAGGESVLVRGEHFDVMENQLALGGRQLDMRTPTTIYSDVFVPLHGRHQGDNAIVALTAVEGFFASPVPDDIVREGFAEVRMAGRFEVLGHQPLVIVDGAHNPPGADSCAQVFFDDFDPAGRKTLVTGILKSRDAAEMLSALRADEFDKVFTCTAPTPRGMPSSEVAAAARAIGCDDVVECDTVENACDRAIRGAETDDAILVTGSLYVVGAARPHLRRVI
jgi:dihydrofolate synthase/folylpolyglutamate synthase